MDLRNSELITPQLIANYCYQFSDAEPEALQRLAQKTIEYGQEKMMSGAYLGRILSMISKIVKPQCILEIGTFTGYGSLCLAEGLADNGLLITIEKNPELKSFSQSHIDELGYTDRIKQHIGDAAEIISELDHTFDLVFIDAAKRQYVNYYELVLPKVRPGGIILADNTLWKGTVVQDQADKLGEGIKKFNAHVRNDDRVNNVLLSLDDGLNLIIKK